MVGVGIWQGSGRRGRDWAEMVRDGSVTQRKARHSIALLKPLHDVAYAGTIMHLPPSTEAWLRWRETLMYIFLSRYCWQIIRQKPRSRYNVHGVLLNSVSMNRLGPFASVCVSIDVCVESPPRFPCWVFGVGSTEAEWDGPIPLMWLSFPVLHF